MVYKLLITLLTVFFLLGALGPSPAHTAESGGKKTGFMGDPASKRGLEYGFDKGFQAGKADRDAGLKPDPKRHEDFNDPEKFYRYEFGSRASFVNGFKSGFVGGYQKAFGKNVRISVPGMKSGEEESPPEEKSAPSLPPPSAGSDAL